MERRSDIHLTTLHPHRSPRRVIGGALIALLMLCAGCSRSGDSDADGDHSRPQSQTRHAPESKPDGTIEVKPDVQRALHLKVGPLSAASALPQLSGYGRVLDPTALSSAVSDWASARASASASRQELARLKILQAQDTASSRAVQAAEAAAERDRLLVESIHDRIALSWGRTLSQRADLTALVRALSSQERAIVRVDVPLGDGAAARPHGARLASLMEPDKIIETEYLGLAPTTDTQLQGRGFLFLTRGGTPALLPGSSVTAFLELDGEALHGVLLPDSALVRHEARTWVYVQRGPATFVRTPVVLGPLLPGGWLITQGLQAEDTVVVDGAQILLSEELKPQVVLGD